MLKDRSESEGFWDFMRMKEYENEYEFKYSSNRLVDNRR